MDLLDLAPVPGLRLAAQLLLNIWDASQQVDVSFNLPTVDISSTDSSDECTELFTANSTMRRHPDICSERDLLLRSASGTRACRPYSKARRVCILCISITADLSHLITRSFESIHSFLIKLTNRPFLKRYLRRDEISRDLSDYDCSLRDALALFSVSSKMFAKSLSYSQHYRFRFKSAYLNKFRKRRNTGRRKPRRSLKRL